jgi:hypothetical protein
VFSGQIITSQLLEAARDHGHDFEVLAKPVPPGEILDRVFSGFWHCFWLQWIKRAGRPSEGVRRASAG